MANRRNGQHTTMGSLLPAHRLAIIAVLLWSSAGAATFIGVSTGHVYQLVFFEYLFSLVGFACIAIARHRISKSFKKFRGSPKIFLAFGLFALLHNATLACAIFIGNPFYANSLNYLWPIFLYVGSKVVFSEKVDPIIIIFLLLSFTGVVLIFLDTSVERAGIVFGSILGIISAFSASIYMIIGSYCQRHTRIAIEEIFLWGYLSMAPILTVVFVFTDASELSWTAFAFGAFLGLGVAVFAEIFWLRAIHQDTTGRTVSLAFLIPLLSSMFVLIVSDRPVSIIATVGSFLAISASTILIWRNSPKPVTN